MDYKRSQGTKEFQYGLQMITMGGKSSRWITDDHKGGGRGFQDGFTDHRELKNCEMDYRSQRTNEF